MSNAAYDYVLTGQYIRQRRYALRWSQTELARRVNCNVNTISALERGVHDMSLEIMIALCRALSCTPNDLLAYGQEGSQP